MKLGLEKLNRLDRIKEAERRHKEDIKRFFRKNLKSGFHMPTHFHRGMYEGISEAQARSQIGRSAS